MDEISLLETQIKKLKEEINNNPQYNSNIIDSILDDIAYYENHLKELFDK
jgi:hypothetical protein